MINKIATKDVIELLGAIGALGGLAFGLYQYSVNQKWQQSELAAKQLEMLSTDPKLWMCCLFLDWATRRIPIPEDYKIFDAEKLVAEKLSERQSFR